VTKWNLLVVKAALHADDSTPEHRLHATARALENSFRTTIWQFQHVYGGAPGIAIDLDGTIRTEADVRKSLGLPPARTDVERLREKLAADHYPVQLYMPAVYCGCDRDADEWEGDHFESSDGEELCMHQPEGRVCASCWTGDGSRAAWPCITATVAGLVPVNQNAVA
jgi:hypothetical protein